jgi:hypothetical protein
MPTHRLTISSDSDWFAVSITSGGAVFTSEVVDFTYQGGNLGQGPLSEGLSLSLTSTSIRMSRNRQGGNTITVGVRTDHNAIPLRVCKGNWGSVRVDSRFDTSTNSAVLGDGENCVPMTISLTSVGRQEQDQRYEQELANQ